MTTPDPERAHASALTDAELEAFATARHPGWPDAATATVAGLIAALRAGWERGAALAEAADAEREDMLSALVAAWQSDMTTDDAIERVGQLLYRHDRFPDNHHRAAWVEMSREAQP